MSLNLARLHDLTTIRWHWGVQLYMTYTSLFALLCSYQNDPLQ